MYNNDLIKRDGVVEIAFDEESRLYHAELISGSHFEAAGNVPIPMGSSYSRSALANDVWRRGYIPAYVGPCSAS